MKSAIIFNGPKESGKDEACKWLLRYNNIARTAKHMEFKKKLVELTKMIYCISDEKWEELYRRENKEVSTPLLDGWSPRQALIHVSEDVIKPKFGKAYFGVAAAKEMCDGYNFFSDGGFIEELEPVYEEVEGRLLIVRIHRPGSCFIKSGDSRRYINEFGDVPIVDLQNDEAVAHFRVKVDKVFNAFEDCLTVSDPKEFKKCLEILCN